MKIAISTDSGMVAEHFGRCPEFTIIDIKDNKVVNKEVIPNPGHSTGFIPKYLNEKGVNCIRECPSKRMIKTDFNYDKIGFLQWVYSNFLILSSISLFFNIHLSRHYPV